MHSSSLCVCVPFIFFHYAIKVLQFNDPIYLLGLVLDHLACFLKDIDGLQDDNRYNAGRGAHINLKRAERARVTVSKIPGMLSLTFI